MAEHNELGRAGEQYAQDYLRSKGYTIRATNWRSGNMEVDIIAENKDFLVIVEVKTRADNMVMHPADSVNNNRIRRLVCAAHDYILKFDIDKETRFDIIALIQHGQDFEVEHIEDAFIPPVC